MSVVAQAPLGSLRDWIKGRWSLAVLILASALVVIGAISLAGAAPAQTLWHLVTSSVGNARTLTGTFREFTPLLVAGIAVFIALRAGLFNIGVEGQFMVGALACTTVALRLPGILGIVLGMAVGMIAGGLWALPAALIKAYKGGHEVITTIMLNNVAGLLTTALVAGPLKDPTVGSPRSSEITEGTYLPELINIGDLHISSGLLIGVLIAVGLFVWLRRSVSGYELEAVGANATAARFAGVNHQRVLVRAMTWSGAFGGLAGAIQVLAFEHCYYPNISSGYGFDALGVALLAGATPIGLLLSAFLFGMLNKGGTAIQVIDQVPKGLTSVILGLLIVIAAAIRYRNRGSTDV